MKDYRFWPFMAAKWGIKYLFADKRTRKMLITLPETCMMCELLGICRDEHNGWRCRCGCLVARNARGSRTSSRRNSGR